MQKQIRVPTNPATPIPRLANKHEYLDQLVVASVALLDKLENITTEQLSKGGEKVEREALRRVLTEAGFL